MVLLVLWVVSPLQVCLLHRGAAGTRTPACHREEPLRTGFLRLREGLGQGHSAHSLMNGHRLRQERFQHDVFLSSLVSLEGHAQDAPKATLAHSHCPLRGRWQMGFLFTAPAWAPKRM